MSMTDDPFAVHDAYSRRHAPYTNGSGPDVDDEMEQQEQERIVGESGWKEPPLRAPQPSFMDTRGLDRVGVLTNMQALGTRPSKRIRDAAKHGRISSIKKMGHGGSESARATPDHASEGTRAASARPEDFSGTTTPLSESFFNTLPEPSQHHQSQQQDGAMPDYNQDSGPSVGELTQSIPYSPHGPPIDPSLFDNNDPVTPVADASASQPPAQTNSSQSQAFHFTGRHSAIAGPAFASVHDKIEHAIVLANNRRPDLHAMITHLHSAVLKDSELSALLAVNSEGPPNEYARRSLRKKIGRVKRSVLVPGYSPARSKTSKGVVSTPVISAPHTQFKGVATTPPQEATPLAHQSHSKHGSPSKRLKLNTVTSSAASNSRAAGSPLKQVAKTPKSRDQRATSSPLSSVDEGIVQQPETIDTMRTKPTINKYGKRALSPSPVNDETERKRQRSKKLQQDVSQAAASSTDRSTLRTSGRDIEKTPIEPVVPGKTGIKLNLGRARLAPADGSAVPAPSSLESGPSTERAKPGAKVKQTRSTTKLATPVAPQPATPAPGTTSRRGRDTATSAAPATAPAAAGPATEAEAEDDDDDNESHTDVCQVCKQGGLLVCCDNCMRDYHAACNEPPLDEDDLPEIFTCMKCVKTLTSTEDTRKYGIFSKLLGQLNLPENAEREFRLPQNIREYFEGNSTLPNGDFKAEPPGQPRAPKGGRRGGKTNVPKGLDTYDRNGRLITCYWCRKTTDARNLVLLQCDHCENYWHTDCLPVPASHPPNEDSLGLKIWMCPLHTDPVLQNLNVIGDRPVPMDPDTHVTHRVRRKRNAKIVDSDLSRGHRNNGNIEIDWSREESDEEGFCSADEGTVLRVPAKGVQLDFIAKVKAARDHDEHRKHRQLLRRRSEWQDKQDALLEQQRRQMGLPAIETSTATDAGREENIALGRTDLATSQAALALADLARDGAEDPAAGDNVTTLIRALIAEALPERGANETNGMANEARPRTPPPFHDDPDGELAELAKLERLIAERRRDILKQVDRPQPVVRPPGPHRDADGVPLTTGVNISIEETDAHFARAAAADVPAANTRNARAGTRSRTASRAPSASASASAPATPAATAATTAAARGGSVRSGRVTKGRNAKRA